MSVLILVAGLVESIAANGFLFWKYSKGASSARDVIGKVDAVFTERTAVLDELRSIISEAVDPDLIKKNGQQLIEVLEALKAERGRNTITQAELETVESRLRELEEIERELEASGIETKEEIKILGKKEKDLRSKNDSLKEDIAASMSKMAEVLAQIEMSAELQEKVDSMKTDLVLTQERIDTLLLQVEQGNEQYFILKKRYDALDIEYAQLFEKFSEAEAQMGAKK